MKLEIFIARRYFLSKRKIGFISLITYFAAFGILLGVAVLNIVLSVMNGFEDVVVNKIVGAISHIQVVKFHNEGIRDYDSLNEQILKNPAVTASSPLIFEKAAIKSDQQGLDALIINGVDTSGIDKVIDLKKYIYGGSLSLDMQFNADKNDSLPGIVLGYDLADRLRVVVGETVLLASLKQADLGTQMPPKLLKCQISGIFRSGFYDYDNAFGFVSLQTAQKLFDLHGQVNQIDIRIKDMYAAREVGKEIESSLKYPYYTMNWIDRNSKLFTWIKLEKKMMFVILNLIVIVAVFNIISALIMLVMNKTREIGILKAMGATKSIITKIFIIDGLIAGIVGTFGGTVLSYILCFLQQKYQFISIPSDLYTINSLPIKMETIDFVIVAFSALFLSFLATLYPSRKAANEKTAEALVYE